jgi:hypothetical protein
MRGLAPVVDQVGEQKSGLADAVDTAILVGLVRHPGLARPEDHHRWHAQGQSKRRRVGEIGNRALRRQFAAARGANREHAAQPRVVGLGEDTADVEQGAQGNLRPQHPAQAAQHLRVALAGDAADVEAEFGGVGHRIDVHAAGDGADVQRRCTHQRVRGGLELEAFERQDGARDLEGGVVTAFGHRAMGSLARGPGRHPERALVAEQGRVRGRLGDHQRTGAAEQFARLR